MTRPTLIAQDPVVTARIFKYAVVIAVALVVLRSIAQGWSLEATFFEAGNDDVMRLMSVRSWLSGQDWFDMTQYRITPPDGLPLHWSRYLDVAIGGLIWTLSLVLPMPVAEHVGAVLWPAILLIALILVTGFSTRRILGSGAAAIAVMAVVVYPPIGFDYFSVGRLDHHNVQILLMTIALFAMILPDRPLRQGGVAGLAAALSLTIGLETLFFVAAIGVIFVLRAAFGQVAERARLMGFGLSIALGCVVLFVGQTPASDWMIGQCDKLSPPFIAVALVGAASSLAALMLPVKLRNPGLFLGVVCGVAVVGLALSWPLLQPCIDGPYGDLPLEVQTLITERITEAIPMVTLARTYPLGFAQAFLPAIVVLVAAMVMVARRKGAVAAIAPMILFGLIALAVCVVQSRQVVLLAAVVPFLMGFVAYPALHRRIVEGSGRSQLMLYFVAAVTLFQPILTYFAFNLWEATRPTASATGGFARLQDDRCKDFDTLRALNDLPAGVILTGMNLGARMIMVTHHDGLSAPYHRSAAAMGNGILPYEGDGQSLRATLRDQGADYVVVCRDSTYGNTGTIGSQLASGMAVPGFDQIDLADPDLMVFSYLVD